jgi:hypothetical protein
VGLAGNNGVPILLLPVKHDALVRASHPAFTTGRAVPGALCFRVCLQHFVKQSVVRYG